MAHGGWATFGVVNEDEYAGADLKRVDGEVAEEQERHVQQRAESNLRLTGCSCGVAYESGDPFAESHAHLRHVLVLATVRALTGVCDTCDGRGVWRKMAGTLTCPDCDGLGETLLPLAPMEYRDLQGSVWTVVKQIDDERALVERRADRM